MKSCTFMFYLTLPTLAGAKLSTSTTVGPANHSNSTVPRDFESSLRENACMQLRPAARPPECTDKLESKTNQ